MKIQVTIEATSIKEYAAAIQALAAGYTVAPNPSITNVLVEGKTSYAEATQAVEQDEIKVAEEKPKRNRTRAAADKPVKEVEKSVEEDKPSEDTSVSKTEEKASEQATDTSEQSGSKYGFPAVKAIATKLSKIQDGKAEVKFLLEKFGAGKLSDIKEENYDEFHELASKAIADHDNTKANAAVEETVKVDKPEKEESSDEVTLEMIRSKAKELSVAGYKEEIKHHLKEIGAPALTKIPKDKLASFYNALGNIG